MTETELKLMADSAMIGLENSPKYGESAPAAMGRPAALNDRCDGAAPTFPSPVGCTTRATFLVYGPSPPRRRRYRAKANYAR